MRMGERREGSEEIRVLAGPNGADVLLAKVDLMTVIVCTPLLSAGSQVSSTSPHPSGATLCHDIMTYNTSVAAQVQTVLSHF